MCDRAIWVDDGQIQAEGPVASCTSPSTWPTHRTPTGSGNGVPARDSAGDPESRVDSSWQWGSGEGSIVQVQFLNGEEKAQSSFETGAPLVVRLCFVAHQRIERPQFGLGLHHASGFHISGPNTVFSGFDIDAIEGTGYIDYIVDSLPLLEGTYLVSVSLCDREGLDMYDYHHQAHTLRVHRNYAVEERYGSFLIPATWRMGPAGG